MTTNTTVEAHSWPVKVIITDDHCHHQKTSGASQEVHTVTTTEEIVPPNTKKTFYITSTRSISFHELPMPEIEDPEELETIAPQEAPVDFEDAMYEPDLAAKVKSD